MIQGIIAILLVGPAAALAQDTVSVQALRQKLATPPSVSTRNVGARAVVEPIQKNGPTFEYQVKSATEASVGIDVLAPVAEYNSNSYQAQPTTLVEDAPLKESRADQLRKRRQSIEEQTELSLVEKLEAERVKDEERRAKKISKSITDEPSESIAPMAEQQVSVQVVAPAPAISQIPSAKDIAPLDKEAASVASMPEISQPTESATRFFVGGFAGLGEYPGAQQVRGNYGVGVTAGLVLPERLIVEGGVTFSTYDVAKHYSVFTEMDQMNIALALKYQVLSSRIRPVIGALASYTRRSFQDRYGYYGYTNNQKTTSQALDAGVVSGLDVVITDSFSIGLDMRYLFNLTYRRDTPYDFASFYQHGNVVEQDSYYLFGINSKITF